ncbi:MAG: sulfatase [Verrucomicrobiales bacterium]|nr:sulfatase [Verrucomicrobiales bacterium]
MLWMPLVIEATAAKVPAARPPNIVLILADDLGWSDLGCYGADLHRTPNLDRLAREGVRFTRAYAMSLCSPTRASILTGQHAARLHMTTWREQSLGWASESSRAGRLLAPPQTVNDLPSSETTLAEALRSAGYLTMHVGKWHLGDAANYPEAHGFDVAVGGTHWGAPATYFFPYRGPSGQSQEFRYVPGLGWGKEGEYLTDRLTDEALKFIDAAGDRPFFLNLWHHSPHTPIEAKSNAVAACQARIRPEHHHQNAGYAAMVESLDESVGRVMEKLRKRRLADQTLVVFASDNGGYTNQFRGRAVTDNFPLRSGKGSLYEGGIRVPLMVRFPGKIAAGAVCDEPVICMDLFPTLLELAGAKVGAGGDGVSLWPLLKNPDSHLSRDALYFHYPHYYTTTTPVGAVISEGWKLMEYFEDGRRELYHLAADPSETKDLSAIEPARVNALADRLGAWRRAVGAQMAVRR